MADDTNKKTEVSKPQPLVQTQGDHSLPVREERSGKNKGDIERRK